MTPNEYQAQCRRTAGILGVKALPMLALGLTGESGELASIIAGDTSSDTYVKDIAYELGDILWYAAVTADALGFMFAEFFVAPTEEPILQLSVLRLCASAGSIADQVKKAFFHDHNPDFEKMGQTLLPLVKAVRDISYFFPYSVEEIMVMNQEKLLKRYPDGFDAERSRNREE